MQCQNNTNAITSQHNKNQKHFQRKIFKKRFDIKHF